ncbi:BRCT domain-containing protein [Photobacterium nomapromontoriensis]|uniref:BRCT domain-containing protein n=1 Tax=Photobacterium nomapromontoriensis TaxID=2910237 RepID=UPI003D101BCD
MNFANLSFDSLEQLDSVHPEVTHLEYECIEPHPSWAQIAQAFPNVTRLEIAFARRRRTINKIPRPLDDELFRHFKALTRLECSGSQLQLTAASLPAMQQLQKIAYAETRSPETLTVIGKLPHLEALQLEYQGHQSGLLCIESPILQECNLRLTNVQEVGIDLTRAISLTDITLHSGTTHSDEPSGPMTLSALMLPSAIKTVELSLSNEVYLHGPLFCAGTLADRVYIEGKNVHFMPNALGHADNINWLCIQTRQSSPLPDDLLANIKVIESLQLSLLDSPVRLDNLLSKQTKLQYIDIDGRQLSVQGPLRLPALTQALIRGLPMAELDWLAHTTELASLYISQCGAFGDANVLATLPQLTTLDLDHLTDQQLPSVIRQLNTLSELTLTAPELSELGCLSAMTALSTISLRLEKYRYPELTLPKLDDLSSAPALTTFKLEVHNKHSLLNNAEHLACLPEQVNCEINIDGSEARAAQLTKQLRIVQLAPLTDDEKRHCWRILLSANKPNDLPVDPTVLGDRFHLAFMEAKYTPFKAHIINWLRQKAEDAVTQHPLGTDTVLFINGKSAFSATELNAKAEELGFTISKTLTEKVTHVLLAANPKNTVALSADHQLIDDTALKQWFDQATPQFLQVQNNVPMVDNVLAMLNSPDASSHQVAVQMLRQGGVTETLVMPLFFILKTTSDKGLRKEIQKLLAGYGDEIFQVAVQDRIFFEDNLRGEDWQNKPTGEGPMYKKLKGLPKRWGRELTIHFAKAYFDRFGEGLLWVLMQKEECAQRQAIIAELIEGECLNWHKGCGFARMLEGADEERLTDCHASPEIFMQNSHELDSAKTRLPVELPATRKITELDMHNCFLADLPANIEHYVDVTKLNLQFNHLSKLPAKLSQLSQLEELDLSYNHFTEFPAVLFKLKNLKRLDLRSASEPLYRHGYDQQHGYEPIRASQTFLDAFPDCEILEDA